LVRLGRPHHLVHAGPGLAGRQPGSGRKRGTGTSDPGMIAYTVPEIRRLLISLIQTRAPDPDHPMVMVPLAAKTPEPSTSLSLPAPRLRLHMSAVAVLVLQRHFVTMRCGDRRGVPTLNAGCADSGRPRRWLGARRFGCSTASSRCARGPRKWTGSSARHIRRDESDRAWRSQRPAR
jgi:hypothetical protein